MDTNTAARRKQIIATFGFPRIVVPGDVALQTWQELRKTESGYPVILGYELPLDVMIERLDNLQKYRCAVEIIARADRIRHPHNLRARRKRLIKKFSFGRPSVCKVGTWPDPEPDPSSFKHHPLDMAIDYCDRAGESQLHPEIEIGVIPTKDWTEIPAYLQWGGWRACHPPEVHIAAFRSWRDRYGAELVAMTYNQVHLRAARRPRSRDEAIQLAQEHDDYNDTSGCTYSLLAATLMKSDWWNFWWES